MYKVVFADTLEYIKSMVFMCFTLRIVLVKRMVNFINTTMAYLSNEDFENMEVHEGKTWSNKFWEPTLVEETIASSGLFFL